jgi:hypothetical protein
MAQYTHLDWEGQRLWTSRGQRLAGEGLDLALEHLLGEAKKLVPLDEGTLERSGTASRDGLTGAVSFDTPYAVRQHEEMDYRHAPGRQAKYLEQPMNTERETLLQLMAVSWRDWLRG